MLLYYVSLYYATKTKRTDELDTHIGIYLMVLFRASNSTVIHAYHSKDL
jgi:hypothetical protein